MKKTLFSMAGKTKIIPISYKILLIFTVILLFSNFATNYITISLSRRETMNLLSEILLSELKELYSDAGNQYQIFLFYGDEAGAMEAMAQSTKTNVHYKNSIEIGVKPDGKIAFGSPNVNYDVFPDAEALARLNSGLAQGNPDGKIYFRSPAGEYFAVYKYNEDWGFFLMRADLMSDMRSASTRVFINVAFIIVGLTIVLGIAGCIAFLHTMRWTKIIAGALQDMQKTQTLSIINLDGASNDDVTYLGVSFNSLASMINNLLTIFRKFTSQDIVRKAYETKHISLAGEQKELAILFSDIKRFTGMTEVLGNDIINLLNVHYNNAIHQIHIRSGVIGSIIGDALLAVFGLIKDGQRGKSVEAIDAAWALCDAAGKLRVDIIKRREEIEAVRELSEAEIQVFNACLLDIGAGIDGGTVFYGTIGSRERMTNTVIGDKVNSASRIEGLTRVYNVEVIVSQYIMLEARERTSIYRFFEVDTIKVKGKMEGVKIYYPLISGRADEETINALEIFEEGLQCYYSGNWRMAEAYFFNCKHNIKNVFLERMNNAQPPEGWNGIWQMATK